MGLKISTKHFSKIVIVMHHSKGSFEEFCVIWAKKTARYPVHKPKLLQNIYCKDKHSWDIKCFVQKISGYLVLKRSKRLAPKNPCFGKFTRDIRKFFSEDLKIDFYIVFKNKFFEKFPTIVKKVSKSSLSSQILPTVAPFDLSNSIFCATSPFLIDNPVAHLWVVDGVIFKIRAFQSS